MGQKRPKLPQLPAVKSTTEQRVKFVPKEGIPGPLSPPPALHSGHPGSQSQNALSWLFCVVVVPCSGVELRGKLVATITEWLAALGMSEYAQRFADNRIDDVSILRDLTDQDLSR